MNKPLRGVVACHGKLAEALIDATERISGVTGVLMPVTNTDCDRGLIERRIGVGAFHPVGGQSDAGAVG